MRKRRIYFRLFFLYTEPKHTIKTKGKELIEQGKEIEFKVQNIINNNNKRYKVTYNTITDDSYQVKITPLYRTCAICKKESSVDSMKFIQDNRVPLLFTGKWLDLKCWINVDAILSRLKSTVPRNLSNLIA